jgi:hypothetical protein
VAALAVSGLIHWLIGHPDTGGRRAASAVELAAQLHHPYSLAYATFHCALLDFWSRRIEVAHERSGDVLKVAGEHDYQIWQALGLVLHGVTTASLGRTDDGLAQTERGAALYVDLRTPPVFWPQVLGLRATACALAGRHADALDLVDQALRLEEGSFDGAKLKVQKADLFVSLGDGPAAETQLRDAFHEARAMRVPMIELQAATRLARLAGAAEAREAIARLQEVYDSFTEGFDTPDLIEARAILDRAEVGG